MSRKEALVFCGVLILVIGVAGIIWAMTGTKQISMDEATIQAKIDAKMPIEKKGVRITNVRLDLSNDRINLSFDASTQKMGTEFKMRVATIGNMRYDEKLSAFYFEPEEVKISDIQANAVDIRGTVRDFVKKLGSKKIVEKGAELAAKADKAIQSAIQEAAAAALQRIPVYEVEDDFKGRMTQAALKKVEVQNHKVIAHVSIWQLTIAAFGYITAIVVGIALLTLICVCPGLPDALFGS